MFLLLRYSTLLLVMLLGVSRPSWADEPIESWRCFDYFGEKQMLLELARYRGAVGEYGVIHLPGGRAHNDFFCGRWA